MYSGGAVVHRMISQLVLEHIGAVCWFSAPSDYKVIYMNVRGTKYDKADTGNPSALER